jgi:hypothetical protein
MPARFRTFVAATAAVALVLGACSGGDDTSDTTTVDTSVDTNGTSNTDDPGGTDGDTTPTDTADPTGGVVEPAVNPDDPGFIAPIDPASEYVTSLCAVDFDAAYASDDPIGNVLEQLRAVPTDDADQAAELAGIVEVLESVDSTQVDDPDTFAAIIEIGVILEARCG